MPRFARPAPDGDSSGHWLSKFANLNASPDVGRGVAPHKALLIFCVLDLIEAGRVVAGRVEMSAELVFRFQTYWSFVVERRMARGDVRMPFHALGGRADQVWECRTQEGFPSVSRDTTRVCLIAPSLWECLQSGAFRKRVRQILLTGKYFTAEEAVALAAAMRLPPPDVPEVDRLKEDAAAYAASQRRGRDGRFKVEVVTRYGFTCALTGYRLTTETANIVEAAHIHQRAESLNDEPTNGLALTPNAHWMFDAGLWSVDDQRRVIVAAERAFDEWCLPDGFRLRAMSGRELFFKDGCTFRPDWRHFEWHRRQRFAG